MAAPSQELSVRYIIIKTRNPRLTIREWKIKSLGEQTAQDVFKEIGIIIGRDFQNIAFRLSTSQKDHEIVIGKEDGEEQFQEMRKTFGKEIHADFLAEHTQRFKIEVEPDADIAQGEADTGDYRRENVDFSAYI